MDDCDSKYFKIITGVANYFVDKYGIDEDHIISALSRNTWIVSLGKEDIDKHIDDFSPKEKDYLVEKYKKVLILDDYYRIVKDSIDTMVMHGHKIDAVSDMENIRAIIKSNFSHTSPQASIKLSGKYAYGLVIKARLPYIEQELGIDCIDTIQERMEDLKYNGPSLHKIENRERIPIEYITMFNQAFIELHGLASFKNMALKASQQKSIIGMFVSWIGDPEMIIRKAPVSWKAYYDVGEMSSTVSKNKGTIRLIDGTFDSSYCEYLTSYFEGIGYAIGTRLKVKHVSCRFRGDEFCDWEISWEDDC